MATAKLTAVVETKGVKRADSDLKRFTKSANDAERKTGKLGKSFKTFGTNASASIAAIDGPLGGISSRITALTTVANSGSVAFTGLAVAATAFASAVVLGTIELDKQAIALKSSEALIRATGNAAGVTASQLEDEARAIALNTLASVDGIRQAQNILLTFNKIQGNVRSDAVGLSQDLAQVFGGTAASQATQLGKALQDPIKGITALTRVGVTFTDQQKEQIKTLQQSGDILSAQAIILNELKGQVGGVAAAVSSGTLAGGYDEFIQRLQETSRSIADSSGSYDLALGFFSKLNGLLEKINYSYSDTASVNDAIGNVNKLRDSYLQVEKNIVRLQKLGIVGTIIVNQEKKRLEEIQAAIDEQNAIIDKVYAKKAQQEADQIKALEDSSAKQKEIAIAAAMSDLEAVKKAGASRLEVISINEQKELDKFSQSNAAKLGLELEFARARKQIRDNADAERLKLAQPALDEAKRNAEALEKEKLAAQEKLQQFIQLNNTELEEVDRVESERLAKLRSYKDEKLIIDSEYQLAKKEIELAAELEREELRQANFEKQKARYEEENALAIQLGKTFSKDVSGGLVDAALAGESMSDVLLTGIRDVAAGVIKASLETFIQQKIVDKLMTGFFVASKVAETSATTAQAAQNAFAATAAIPIVGPALAPAAAATAGATAASLGAAVISAASAREQGGMLASGQTSTVAERGLEILTPANASRVRTASDMKNIMGESNSAPNVNIVVIDQSDGNKEFDQSTDDEGRIVLLIRNTVSGDLSQSNSQISKSLSGNTTAQRRRA